MSERDVIIEAANAVLRVVNQLPDDKWNENMPSDFPSADPATTKTFREVINHIASDIAWIPDMLAGKTIDEVGKDTFAGDLLGDDPKGNFASIVATSVAAVRELPDLDSTVHCSYADYPARNYFVDISAYYGLSAYDIAKAVGLDTTLSPTLVEGLLKQITPVAEEWRAMGILGPEIKVSADADAQTRLLGMVGRQP